MHAQGFIRLAASIALACLLPMAAQADDDAPDRVARLNYFDGNVSFSPAGDDDWRYATLNRPLTSGDRLWADQGGRAELHVGSHALRLGPRSSMEVLTLDDQMLQTRLDEGSLSVRVRELWDGEKIEIDTPNLAFEIRAPGEYRIDVDPDNDATVVTVRQGEGMAYGDDRSNFRLRSSAQVRFVGSRLDTTRAGDAPRRDGFDSWTQARDQREDKVTSTRYVSRDTTGYEDLDQYGNWQQESEYGAVWVPRVTVDNWAPYRYGHWAWIAPWGWTWVDDAPWGFAPFHYGRWAYVRSRWCWVPGPLAPRPVYAPALVAFAGGGNGWSVSISSGRPGLAWFPLGPGEAYRPVYRASPVYVTRINRTVNITRINQTVYFNQRAPHAITSMPAEDFVNGRPVPRGEHRFDERNFRNARFSSSPEVAPVQNSMGGNARPWAGPSPDNHRRQNVVENHRPDTPPAWRDDMARRYLREGSVVDRAGPPPSHLTRNPPANQMPPGKPADTGPGRRPPMPDAGHLTPMPVVNEPSRPGLQAQPPANNRPPMPDAGHLTPMPAYTGQVQAPVPKQQDNGVPRPPERIPRWTAPGNTRDADTPRPPRQDDRPQREDEQRQREQLQRQQEQLQQQQQQLLLRDQQGRAQQLEQQRQQLEQRQREQAQRQQQDQEQQRQREQRQREDAQREQSQRQQQLQQREQQERQQRQMMEQQQRQAQEQQRDQMQRQQREQEQRQREGQQREQAQREQMQRQQQMQQEQQQREQRERQQAEREKKEAKEREQREQRDKNSRDMQR